MVSILSLLPPLHGKSVLELGAGIGRFTGELAKDAGQVIAVDFIDSVIKRNESTNGHFKNVNFMCADVTSPNMQIQPESVDLIFSNWLLMYLSDKEVENLVERMMKWLKVDGFIFFRESCFHQSGDCKRRNNPTHYREPRFYTKILSLLPPLHGKSVLELGAGIGRFTGELAKDAGQNESTNGHFKNVSFMCAHVTSPNMQIQPESVDLIFSNWLLMYLSDKEVENLVERMMKWLKVDGFIFFRESCFHQSGDCKRRNNPTHYREPRFYTKAFKDCHAHDGFGTSFELSLISFKCITAYVRSKKNQNQANTLFFLTVL
ncbi:hypothetical protein MRB53_028645 [Persea americana]|uniref:Uncharacterized protein n=2 Tax=Persea americana TaxID=3435 RepID=A0ACC2KGA1_PERAE|nr:hypothetical protein MRB53_028641 [Persea americana]KAJ8620116.1 hypothetical protein MRB53_028645 [Persea americana]